MKRIHFNLLFTLIAAAVLAACSDDDNAKPKVLLPKLDGFYVYGTNTVAAGPSEQSARMVLAVLDPSKAPNISSAVNVYGKFLYIGANSTINFALVEGAEGKVYGADKGGTVSRGIDIENVPVDDNVIHGELKENGDPIKIANEGLYYVFADVNDLVFVCVPVRPSMIGDATPNDWASGTLLPLKSLSKSEAIYEASIPLVGASGYRYKINDGGWHAYQKEGALVSLFSLGVPDYGAAWESGINDIGFHLDNAPHKVDGVHTVTLTYNFANNQWKEVKTKTGELLLDYSDYNVSIIGDATEGGTFNGDGTGGYGGHVPTKSGNTYTWKWENVPFIAEREFIFLRNATWGSGLQLDYAQVTVTGSAISNGDIVNAKSDPINHDFDNFYVVNAGTYDVTLAISGETGEKTVTIVKK
jgi:hypothetical protein